MLPGPLPRMSLVSRAVFGKQPSKMTKIASMTPHSRPRINRKALPRGPGPPCPPRCPLPGPGPAGFSDAPMFAVLVAGLGMESLRRGRSGRVGPVLLPPPRSRAAGRLQHIQRAGMNPALRWQTAATAPSSLSLSPARRNALNAQGSGTFRPSRELPPQLGGCGSPPPRPRG